MLATRLIPCLLMSNGALVKSVRFKDYIHIGDPINAVRIFNQKEVDELIILDIHATTQNRGIDFETLNKIVSECFMPVCYGGGVRSLNDMHRLFTLGIEKVSLSSAVFEVPGLLKKAAAEFGSQAITITMDIKKNLLGKYIVKIHNASCDAKMSAIDAAKYFENEGAGELHVYSIDRDGTWSGFDVGLVESISSAVDIPVIASGGAGSFEDIRNLVQKTGVSAVAIGSMAVLQNKDLGVLIKFPSRKDQEGIFKNK